MKINRFCMIKIWSKCETFTQWKFMGYTYTAQRYMYTKRDTTILGRVDTMPPKLWTPPWIKDVLIGPTILLPSLRNVSIVSRHFMSTYHIYLPPVTCTFTHTHTHTHTHNTYTHLLLTDTKAIAIQRDIINKGYMLSDHIMPFPSYLT